MKPLFISATALLAFAAHWNLVLYPKIVLNDKNWATVQIALTELLQKFDAHCAQQERSIA